jgi:hypothetical protein
VTVLSYKVEASKRFLRATNGWGFGDHVTDPRAFVLRARVLARRMGALADLAWMIKMARP